jgi:GNAT superfamily N-acetyltransferase
VTQVSLADPIDRNELSNCLAAAYQDNPLFGWMFGHELCHAVLCDIFTGLLSQAIALGCVYRASDNLGAAIWSEARSESSGGEPPKQPLTLGTSAGRRMAALGVLEAHRPTKPHAYLAAVGVHPKNQRRGTGTELLTPALEKYDAAGVDAYLENSDPRNTSFYLSRGFRSLGALPMPVGCPPVVAMIRKAPSRSQG